MFEQFRKAAEQTTTNLSRRSFFGRIGKTALPAVALLNAVLFSKQAQARDFGVTCCIWYCGNLFGSPERKIFCESGRNPKCRKRHKCSFDRGYHASFCNQCN